MKLRCDELTLCLPLKPRDACAGSDNTARRISVFYIGQWKTEIIRKFREICRSVKRGTFGGIPTVKRVIDESIVLTAGRSAVESAVWHCLHC